MTKRNLLKGLTLPKNTDFKFDIDEKNGGKFAEFTVYPFERGFGTTIGNTLRRVLLSSIQGYAVSAIMITLRENGKTVQITNEFESLPGVKEDLLEIIASLKKLSIQVDAESHDSIQFVVPCKGPGTITGKDFEKNNVKIINSELVILTMEDDVDMDIEVQIDWGRGYISCDQKEDYKEQFGVIAIDSIFSPITRVNYTIEPVRVGTSSEFDKLIMQVWTNGTIKASKAVSQAAYIAQKYLDCFAAFENIEPQDDEDDSVEIDEEVLNTPVLELGLNPSTAKSLDTKGFKTVADLISKSEEDLKKLKVTDASIEKIKEKLAEKGLSLREVSSKLIRS